jgi:hypothetical protein
VSSYDFAQICINGHKITESYNQFPEFRSDFCKSCGASTIHKCPCCKVAIRGHYRGGSPLSKYEIPSFCGACGMPFPWTEQNINAALELFAEETSDKAELDQIKKSLEAIAANTPEAKLAWYRLDKKIKGLTDPLKQLAYDLTVSVMSEVAKEALLGKGNGK